MSEIIEIYLLLFQGLVLCGS